METHIALDPSASTEKAEQIEPSAPGTVEQRLLKVQFHMTIELGNLQVIKPPFGCLPVAEYMQNTVVQKPQCDHVNHFLQKWTKLA
ncbi:hypothetical protein VIGAN_08268000 [Vigna angularis var. angularis]|uniref:Uncharacterized protein n=1 Tax=Vigna angularis var. angularis TaxID=157739 RepID=A0A0S3SSR6_PHAAN|nr:hypothetical protein VIGAN_08268000 [Vigna angularis var. angularis]